MRRLISVLLLFCAVTALASPAADAITLQRRAMHEIWMGDEKGLGECTATAVGAHALMTAEHCISQFKGSWALWVDGERPRASTDPTAYTVDSVARDGVDHVFLLVKGPAFPYWVPFLTAQPFVGQRVHWVGCPGGFVGIYREGAVVGSVPAKAAGDDFSQPAWVVQAPSIPGDSGSAVFDEDGNLVALVTFGGGGLMGMYALHFTPGQIAAAQNFGG